LGTGEYWSNLYCLQKVTIVGFVTLPSTLFQQFCQFFSFPLFRQIHGTIANTIHTNQDFADVAVGLDDTLINATTATTTPVPGATLVLTPVVYTAIIGIRFSTGADTAVAEAAVAHTAIIHARLCLERFAADGICNHLCYPLAKYFCVKAT
jgi:hypothetical protein